MTEHPKFSIMKSYHFNRWLVLLFISLISFSACSKNQAGIATYTDPAYADLQRAIDTLPLEPLSDEERSGLIQMREEEKLARDVYIYLYQKWSLKPFSNISSSEQMHMDAVLALLNKYAIPDPAKDKLPGVFSSPALQALYNSLIEKGNTSLVDALTVGATIEDLDIYDLKGLVEKTDNKDILLVYDNLARGSRNHIRAFTRNLTQHGGSYTPVYLTPEEYKIIIEGSMETGRG